MAMRRRQSLFATTSLLNGFEPVPFAPLKDYGANSSNAQNPHRDPWNSRQGLFSCAGAFHPVQAAIADVESQEKICHAWPHSLWLR